MVVYIVTNDKNDFDLEKDNQVLDYQLTHHDITYRLLILMNTVLVLYLYTDKSVSVQLI